MKLLKIAGMALVCFMLIIGCTSVPETYNKPPVIKQYVIKKKFNNDLIYETSTDLYYRSSIIYSVEHYSSYEDLSRVMESEMQKAYDFWGKYYYPRTNVVNKIEGEIK